MGKYYRKIIRITAQDSPNVQYAEKQISLGITPTDDIICPGVLTWGEYQKRRATWDRTRQKVGLDAIFPEDEGDLLFPPDWLLHSERLHKGLLHSGTKRRALSIGIDPAEGSDKTTMCAVDEFGVVDLVSKKTPNTAVITSEAIAFGRLHSVPPEKWIFDRGGGGKQHADRLREQGYDVRTVAFGESLSSQEPRKGTSTRRLPFARKVDEKESRYAYFNRRSEMYGHLSLLIDPHNTQQFDCPSVGTAIGGMKGFAIPGPDVSEVYAELRHQLSLIPKRTDAEGRLKMLPKNRSSAKSNELTLKDIIGHSPDEADALVLAVYGLTHEVRRLVIGAMW